MPAIPRIAIVGGGPGGLMLARLLQVHGIASTVFEREAHALERPQGGTLDLHADSGLLALEYAGLAETARALLRYEDQGTRLADMAGRVLFDDDGQHGDRPEIDRTALRALLLDALPADCVRWDRSLRTAVPDADGRWSLVFDDGEEGPYDLVVGADGTWSRIRPLLSPYKPQYSGLTFVEFGIDDVDRRHPALARLVGRGKFGAEGEGKALIVQRNGNAHLRGYAIFRVPTDWAARRFDPASPAAMRDALIAEFAGYADAITDLLRAAGDTFALRPIHALPVGHCWANRRGLTLIGDAAHVMSPFGGDGVNNAMHDALALAQRIAQDTDWHAAVTGYEAWMFEHVAASAEGAMEAAATLLSHDGLALTLETYRAIHAMADPALPEPAVAVK